MRNHLKVHFLLRIFPAAALAAILPGAPITPPPGWAPANEIMIILMMIIMIYNNNACDLFCGDIDDTLTRSAK